MRYVNLIRTYSNLVLLALIGACAAQTRVGISPTIEAELAALHNEVKAGRDSNSTLVFSLAVGGLALCALAYPVGKLIWMFTSSATGAVTRQLRRRHPEESPDEPTHQSSR